MTRMWKRWLALSLVAGVAGAAQAQQVPAPVDSARPMAPGMRGVRTPMARQREPMSEERLQQLRLQVEERFGRMVQQELQLTEQQMDRVRTATRALEDRRRDFQRRDADLRRAMDAQLQPGVAANQDSLGRMLDAMGRLNVERAQSDQQYLRDLQFLNAVQRTRLLMMQRRLQERMRAIRERQGVPGPMGPAGPGMGPGQGKGAGVRPLPPPQPDEEQDEDDELAALIDP